MPHRNIVPVTFRLQRHLDHQPRAVFDCYADVEQRRRWKTADDETILYGSHDFRTGGTDHFVRSLCPTPTVDDGGTVAGTTSYEHIIDDERIVLSERLVRLEDELLAISLVSWTISPVGTGALLSITDQTTSVTGSGPIEGGRYSYELMLDRLERHLAARVP